MFPSSNMSPKNGKVLQELEFYWLDYLWYEEVTELGHT